MTDDDDIKRRILEAIARLPGKPNLRELSLALGRNHAYLQQYFSRGSPRHLPEEIRHRLARLLEIDPAMLARHREDLPHGETLAVPFIIRHEKTSAAKDTAPQPEPWHFPHAALRQYGIADSGFAALRLARIGDDSPGLIMRRGDVVLLNTADRDPGAAGYFALDTGRLIRIRHVEKAADALTVSHDARHGYTVLEDAMRILGRVLFHFRMLL